MGRPPGPVLPGEGAESPAPMLNKEGALPGAGERGPGLSNLGGVAAPAGPAPKVKGAPPVGVVAPLACPPKGDAAAPLDDPKANVEGGWDADEPNGLAGGAGAPKPLLADVEGVDEEKLNPPEEPGGFDAVAGAPKLNDEDEGAVLVEPNAKEVGAGAA